MSPPLPRPSPFSISVLVLAVLFCVWWRGHTFGSSIKDLLGFAPYPVVGSTDEPLDCDEAYYGYLGHIVVEGKRLYVDASENKPPLGYLLYALAIGIGGYNELAVRILPIPFVIATVVSIWWAGRRLAGDKAACLSSLLYVVASTDPYLYGNGAQLEQFMNLGTTACLALMLSTPLANRRSEVLWSGLALGLAMLVKQVAILPGLVAVAYLLLAREGHTAQTPRSRLRDVGLFCLGSFIPVAIATAYLVSIGAGNAAYDDIFRFGRALATDTLPDPSAPPPVYRWFTGNADPQGVLPPPFGQTNYLVWWATGSWPFWLVVGLAILRLVMPPYRSDRLLLLGWLGASWAMVVAPGLYWAHYYLLAVPSSVLAVGVLLHDLSAPLVHPAPLVRLVRKATLIAVGLFLAGFVAIQSRDYLTSTPQQLTERYKGGRQWVVLREQAGEIRERAAGWKDPGLLVWGWQSPLYFYTGIDAPSRHAFTNNLMRDHAGTAHPIVGPRIRELISDLRRDPPEIIATGYPPFDELTAFLREGYLPSRLRGAVPLWIRRDLWAEFEADSVGTRVSRQRLESLPLPRLVR